MSEAAEEIVPGRWRVAASWEALMDRALVTRETERPSLAQSLTRLHYLDDVFIAPPEWAELEWLVQEARHYHERRESKHPLWKWGPRQSLRRKTEHFLARAGVKSAAILKTLEDRFLVLRGRAPEARAPGKRPPAPSWRDVEVRAGSFGTDDATPDVWATARLLEALIPPLEFLLRATVWLEPGGDVPAQQTEDFDHCTWHAREVRTVPRPQAGWQRPFYVSRANELTLVSLEKLAPLLRSLRQRLVRWDSGWSGDIRL